MDRSMYILRVHYRNGRMLDYNFADLALAQSCFETMCKAKAAGSNVQFSDQAGRIADIGGADVDTVQLVDVVAEAQATFTLVMLVEELRARMLAQQQQQRAPNGPADFDEQGRPMPAGGAIGRFVT